MLVSSRLVDGIVAPVLSRRKVVIRDARTVAGHSICIHFVLLVFT